MCRRDEFFIAGVSLVGLCWAIWKWRIGVGRWTMPLSWRLRWTVMWRLCSRYMTFHSKQREIVRLFEGARWALSGLVPKMRLQWPCKPMWWTIWSLRRLSTQHRGRPLWTVGSLSDLAGLVECLVVLLASPEMRLVAHPMIANVLKPELHASATTTRHEDVTRLDVVCFVSTTLKVVNVTVASADTMEVWSLSISLSDENSNPVITKML